MCSILWSIALLLRMIAEGRLVPQLWTTAVVGFGILVDLNFINIFVTDLYPGEGRRLHEHDLEHDLDNPALTTADWISQGPQRVLRRPHRRQPLDVRPRAAHPEEPHC